MKRHEAVKDVLHGAEKLVNGPRANYGDMRKNLQHTADLWSAYLDILDAPLKARDVAQMMSLLKKSRVICGVFNRDNYVDDAGYTAIAAALDAESATEYEPNLDEIIDRINNKMESGE